jgi:hypothetical protein
MVTAAVGDGGGGRPGGAGGPGGSWPTRRVWGGGGGGGGGPPPPPPPPVLHHAWHCRWDAWYGTSVPLPAGMPGWAVTATLSPSQVRPAASPARWQAHSPAPHARAVARPLTLLRDGRQRQCGRLQQQRAAHHRRGDRRCRGSGCVCALRGLWRGGVSTVAHGQGGGGVTTVAHQLPLRLATTGSNTVICHSSIPAYDCASVPCASSAASGSPAEAGHQHPHSCRPTSPRPNFTRPATVVLFHTPGGMRSDALLRR